MEQAVKKEILNTFDRSRISSLLYFGTRAFNINTTDCSDYDLLLILDTYQDGDALKVKEIADKPIFKNIDLGLNRAYKEDIEKRGKDNFQLRSLSTTFYKYLEDAQILIGSNIFKENPIHLSQEEISRLFDLKIQEYYGRCDKLYTKKYSDKKIFQQEAKYVRDILKYFLIMEGISSINDFTKLDFQLVRDLIVKNNLFDKDTIKSFSLLKKDFEANDDLKELEQLRRNIYCKYLSIREL